MSRPLQSVRHRKAARIGYLRIKRPLGPTQRAVLEAMGPDAVTRSEICRRLGREIDGMVLLALEDRGEIRAVATVGPTSYRKPRTYFRRVGRVE